MMKQLTIILLGLLLSMLLLAGEVQLPFVVTKSNIQADFDQPTAIASATDGRIFVLDGMNSRIVVFSDAGKQLLVITANKNIPQFSKAVGLTWNAGFLYIADSSHNRILVLTDKGSFVREINLQVTVPERYWPEPVAVSVVNGTLVYSDRRHHRICLIQLDANINSKQQCTGKRGEQPGHFQFPSQIAIDRDNYLHVVDVINGRIQVFNSRGQYFSQEGEFAVDVLYRPNGIAIDVLGYQYVSDAYLGTIAVFEKGRFRGTLKDEKGQEIKFSTPVGLWNDAKALYVVDATTNSVHKLQLSYKMEDEAVLKLSRQSPDVSRKNCIACHYSWGFAEEEKLQDEQGADPVASLNMCYSCHHGVVFESRQAIPNGGQHPTVYDPLDEKQKRQKNLPREDDIPEDHPLLSDGEMLCASCHTPHNSVDDEPTLYEDNNNSWMRIVNEDSDLCENCHESNKKTVRERDAKKIGKNHPLGFFMSKPPKGDKSGNYSKDTHLHKGLPKSFVVGGAALSRKGEMVCQSCHQIHGGEGDNLVTVSDENGKMCGECHKRQSPKGKKGARKAGVHPVNVELEEPVEFRGKKVKKVICQSCHSVHDGTVGTPMFPDKIKDAEKLCVDCHERQHAEDTDDALEKGIHPMNEDLKEEVEIGEKKVKQMGCLSCHTVHSGKPNTPALVLDHRNGELCENCHENKQRVVGTDHDFRVTAKESQNQHEETPEQSGACGTCHSMHRGKGEQPYLNAAIVTQKKERDDAAPSLATDALCLNCHQDGEKALGKEKPIEHYGHPHKDILMRSDPEKMPLLKALDEKIEEIGVIACITCHEPHSWKPIDTHEKKPYTVLDPKKQENVEGNALTSFLRHKGVKNTFCVDCHGIEAMAKYKYFHHEDKMRDIGVDYLK